MRGIISYGGYIPMWRLERKSALESMGWYAPELRLFASGERAFCDADEDALTMAVAASKECLAGIDKSEVRSFYLASTTMPFADRLNAGIAKTALNLKDELRAQDISGCQRAGTSALISALSESLGAEEGSILVAASDRRLAKSASAEELWQGDGAAAVLVGSDRVMAEFLGSYSITRDFLGSYREQGRDEEYVWEERWIREKGYANLIPEVISGLLGKLSLSMKKVHRVAYPCFSPAEHRKIGERLGVSDRLVDNLQGVVGDTGAAHPLVMLVSALEKGKPGDVIVVAGYGSGADALCFRLTGAIAEVSNRRGISGSIARKRVTDNYARFLATRGCLDLKTGIRREAPKKTALTALYRNRDMLLGLVGGRCESCNTVQFPRSRLCANPECRARDTQTPYEFADRTAVLVTYTADYLGPSASPPNLYGMILFDGGGRMLAELADCDLTDLEVGRKVEMCFRKRYQDENRGFHGYFWKATPLPEEEA